MSVVTGPLSVRQHNWANSPFRNERIRNVGRLGVPPESFAQQKRCSTSPDFFLITDCGPECETRRCKKDKNCSFRHRETGQYVVLDSTLVTIGAGLAIQQIVPGYHLCQVSFQLPGNTKREDIEAVLLKQGLAQWDFNIHKVEKKGGMQDVSVIIDAKIGNTLVGRIEEGFPKLKFQVDHIPNWVSGNMKENQPALTLTWDSNRDRRADSLSTETTTVYERLGIDRRHRMKTCSIVTPNTDSATNKITLRIEFEALEDAQIAAHKIQANPPELQSFTCSLPTTHQYSIRIPLAQYEAQKKQWLDLTDGRNKEEAFLDWKIVGSIVSVQIQGENKASIGALKVRIEKLSRGDVLEGPHWHPSFASPQESTSFFKEVTKTSRVHLCCEPETQALRVYGEPGGTVQARQMIQEEVNRRKQVLTRTPLPNLDSADFFVKAGLGKLRELVGKDNVELTKTSTWAAIKIRGGEEAKHHLQRLIRDSLFDASAKDPAAGTCPICFNEVEYPEVLECGHVYCPECLNDYLASAADNKTFPIVCMGNEGTCGIPIALPVLRSFLPHAAFRRLVEAAVTSYVERNPAEIRYCKTPDCRQTYRPDPERAGIRLVCPSCFVTTCSSCGIDHGNMTCREYHIQQDQEEQTRLTDELAANSGFKKCPRCAVWIEKDGGCNRVSCRCGATICWICLGDFSIAHIYEHIKVVHANNLYN